MKKYYVMLILSMFFAGFAAAQTGSGGSGTGTIVVPPVEDGNDIVQFNNLRITEIVSSSEIRAVTNYDFPNPCIKFDSPASSRGVSFPCPMPMGAQNQSQFAPSSIRPDFIYTIKVSPQTILLLRDRTRASFSDFEVNNRINVYGFYDSGTNTLDSLIIRNISKPSEKRFIQLNNLEIINISSSSLPATITAQQSFSYPCFEYGMMGSGPARSMPCPLGMSKVTDSRFPAGLYREYSIEISASTTLLDRNRNRIDFGKISNGDKINVYGLYDESTQKIEGLIVRDLSNPAEKAEISGTIVSVGGDGSFVVRTDSGEEFTIKPGLAAGMRVEISGFVDRVTKVISEISRLLIKR